MENRVELNLKVLKGRATLFRLASSWYAGATTFLIGALSFLF